MKRSELVRDVTSDAKLNQADKVAIAAHLKARNVAAAEQRLVRALATLPDAEAQKHRRRLADTITG